MFPVGGSVNRGDAISCDRRNPYLGRGSEVTGFASIRPVSTFTARLNNVTRRFHDVRAGDVEVFDARIVRPVHVHGHRSAAAAEHHSVRLVRRNVGGGEPARHVPLGYARRFEAEIVNYADDLAVLRQSAGGRDAGGVEQQRAAATRKEAFVHRSLRPGTTMEVDFGESWVDITGVPSKVKYLVATLPFSNAYFAKAYRLERLESLLDGIESAFRYYGGVVERVVPDNTSLAVKDVLAGPDRVLTEAFEAFRGGYPFRAEFCAPAKGWEKGSVETGVKYVRNLVFRPRLAVESWAAVDATLLLKLEADLPMRHLDDRRTVEQALAPEREHLRPMPTHLPATCRVVARVADKFGHVRFVKSTALPLRAS